MPISAHTLTNIVSAVGWTVIGAVIFYLGTRFYDYLDPIDYRVEIAKGNVAAAIKLSAIIVSLGAIVVAAMLG